MKVFITGIAGGVGGHVARQLFKSGHHVNGWVRKSAKKVSVEDIAGAVTRPAGCLPQEAGVLPSDYRVGRPWRHSTQIGAKLRQGQQAAERSCG
jgi:nucleoside-diphosphate-sugar epimerase